MKATGEVEVEDAEPPDETETGMQPRENEEL